MFSISRFGLLWTYDEAGKVSVFNESKLIYSYHTDGISDSEFRRSINSAHNWMIRNMK